jgi:hypothetical protein
VYRVRPHPRPGNGSAPRIQTADQGVRESPSGGLLSGCDSCKLCPPIPFGGYSRSGQEWQLITTPGSFDLAGADLSDLELETVVLPPQADEFTCVSCFLVKHRSQIDHQEKLGPICQECAA